MRIGTEGGERSHIPLRCYMLAGSLRAHGGSETRGSSLKRGSVRPARFPSARPARHSADALRNRVTVANSLRRVPPAPHYQMVIVPTITASLWRGATMAVTLPNTVDRTDDVELLELVIMVSNATAQQDALEHYGRSHPKSADWAITLPG
jgi:hypothetical protein